MKTATAESCSPVIGVSLDDRDEIEVGDRPPHR